MAGGVRHIGGSGVGAPGMIRDPDIREDVPVSRSEIAMALVAVVLVYAFAGLLIIEAVGLV